VINRITNRVLIKKCQMSSFSDKECPGCEFDKKWKDMYIRDEFYVPHTCGKDKPCKLPDVATCDMCSKSSKHVKGKWIYCKERDIAICPECKGKPLADKLTDTGKWEIISK
jgi:hypothetical protein